MTYDHHDRRQIANAEDGPVSMSSSEVGRRKWLAALGPLLNPLYGVEATQAMVRYLPALRDMPDHLFCDESLRLVATERYRQAVPSLGEMRRQLEIYHRLNATEPLEQGPIDRRIWAQKLGRMSSPSFPQEAIFEVLGYMPRLADFPDAAFTAESLTAAATVKKRQSTPAFDEVHGALREWWRDNRPRPPAIAAPRARAEPEVFVPPTPEQRAEMARTVGEMLANVTGKEQGRSSEFGTGHIDGEEMGRIRAEREERATARAKARSSGRARAR